MYTYTGEPNPHSIVFDRRKFEDDDKFWDEIIKGIQVITSTENVVKFYADELGIYVLEYAHDESIEEYGEPYLVWASREDVEALDDMHEEEGDD